jgi:hypothetical protein
MTSAKVLPAVGIVAPDLHIRISEADGILLPLVFAFDDELLLSEARLAFADTSDGRHYLPS